MLKDKIYHEIIKDINSGKIMPGERLTERQLGKIYNCSRGPVREALNQLEKEGFLSLVPYQGAKVKKYSPEDINDYFSLKEALDGKAAEWAAPLLSKKDILHLKSIHNGMKKLSSDEKDFIRKWQSANRDFHRFIREKSGNKKMNWLIDEILFRVIRYHFYLVMRERKKFEKDHDDIIRAFIKKDALGAKTHMEIHVRKAGDLILEFVTQTTTI